MQTSTETGEAKAKKVPRCRYCDEGNTPRNGEHWIVKSIIPARITVKPCKRAKATGAAS